MFLSDSQDCVLLVASGQMRLHNCHNCVVYLHCTSKPVIELSDSIKFAPLPSIFVSRHVSTFFVLAFFVPWRRRLKLAQMDYTSLHRKPNTWDQVEDFNWLSAEPSPHWTTIDVEDRIPDELWQSVLHQASERHMLRRILSTSI